MELSRSERRQARRFRARPYERHRGLGYKSLVRIPGRGGRKDESQIPEEAPTSAERAYGAPCVRRHKAIGFIGVLARHRHRARKSGDRPDDNV